MTASAESEDGHLGILRKVGTDQTSGSTSFSGFLVRLVKARLLSGPRPSRGRVDRGAGAGEGDEKFHDGRNDADGRGFHDDVGVVGSFPIPH